MRKGTGVQTRRKGKAHSFLYSRRGPRNPDYNVYTDRDPNNTIPIRFTTLGDVRDTIRRLESMYKRGTYEHRRIVQVALILKVRLGVLRAKKPREYMLAAEYLDFLHGRTRAPEAARRGMVFTSTRL